MRHGPVADLFVAEHEALGRKVFIKALGRGILPTSPFAAGLEREARLLTTLDDPRILGLLDFVKTDAAMWLVLEHVDGFTLESILQKKRLSPAGACAIALRVAEALAHAHSRGIVHRDVQPANILVSREGTVKLANFAAAADERLPTAPELLDGSAGFGLPAYMSPEQLLGEPEDPRSDLFSLGIVLYEAIAGKRPFDAPDDRAQSHKIRHDPVTPLARVREGVSGALDRLLRRCLEKLPSDRFPSADELARALSAEVPASGEPIEAVVVRELASLSLVPAREGPASPVAAARTRRAEMSVARAFEGYVVAFVLIVAGGVVIQYGVASGRGEGSAANGTRLALNPARPGFLRVVAEPWANVFVDGELVDTTPFARAIPLPPGIHYVRLEHPRAPVERRTVRLSTGETVLVDVKMDVERPRVAPEPSSSASFETNPSTP